MDRNATSTGRRKGREMRREFILSVIVTCTIATIGCAPRHYRAPEAARASGPSAQVASPVGLPVQTSFNVAAAWIASKILLDRTFEID